MENINGNHGTAFEDFVSENDPKISNKECLPSANEVAVRQCSHLCLSVYSRGSGGGRSHVTSTNDALGSTVYGPPVYGTPLYRPPLQTWDPTVQGPLGHGISLYSPPPNMEPHCTGSPKPWPHYLPELTSGSHDPKYTYWNVFLFNLVLH